MKWFALLLSFILSATACPTGQQASWYGEDLRGRLMANGHAFDPDAFTCASWFFPLGTRLRVTGNGRSVIVVVTDRGPSKKLVAKGRTIDLSAAAFRELAPLREGLVNVNVEVFPAR